LEDAFDLGMLTTIGFQEGLPLVTFVGTLRGRKVSIPWVMFPENFYILEYEWLCNQPTTKVAPCFARRIQRGHVYTFLGL
jgi:hypothetical protein